MNRFMRLAGISLLGLGSAFAAAISHNGTPDNTTTTSIIGITGSATTGNEMSGMLVSVVFGSGGTASCSWIATGAQSGGCTGTSSTSSLDTFSLSLDGDTFAANWVLSATGRLVQSITINALLGATVFDIINGGDGTPGSANGFPVTGTVTNQVNTVGIGGYSNRIQVGANAPVGDLYGVLTINFDGLVSAATFRADTDSVGLPGGPRIPEPGTWAMMLSGLGAAALLRRRR